MRPDEVRTLFDYNYWARDRVLASLESLSEAEYARPNGFNYGSLRGILAHTLDAEYSWRCRFVGERDSLIEEDHVATPALLRARWGEEEALMRAYLVGITEDELAGEFRYLAASGTERRLPRLWLSLVHVVNHSTQHRSEAAEALTMIGRSPGDLDLGLYAREMPNA